MTEPESRGVELHVRAEALIVEQGLATRGRTGELVYDAEALAAERINEGDAYAEALAAARKESAA